MYLYETIANLILYYYYTSYYKQEIASGTSVATTHFRDYESISVDKR
jgi:hypothetical protein